MAKFDAARLDAAVMKLDAEDEKAAIKRQIQQLRSEANQARAGKRGDRAQQLWKQVEALEKKLKDAG